MISVTVGPGTMMMTSAGDKIGGEEFERHGSGLRLWSSSTLPISWSLSSPRSGRRVELEMGKAGFDVVPLTPERWPDLEDLFGPKGACYGCWCNHFRMPQKQRMPLLGEGARCCSRSACARAAARRARL